MSDQWKAQQQQTQYELARPAGQVEDAEEQLRDLQNQPCPEAVHHGHAYDVATLQFRDYGHA